MANIARLLCTSLVLYGFGLPTFLMDISMTAAQIPTVPYTCDPASGGRSQSCVVFSRFNDYQYAHCITDGEVRNRTNNTQQCSDSCRSYCLLTCMAERYGVFEGNVKNDCRCYPTETTDAATQVPSWCLNPQGQIEFFFECIPSTYSVCINMTAIQDNLRIQNTWLTDTLESRLEEDCAAKAFVRDFRKCLQAELIGNLTTNTPTCSEFENTLYPGIYAVCLSLHQQDFCALDWHVKERFTTDFVALISADVRSVIAPELAQYKCSGMML